MKQFLKETRNICDEGSAKWVWGSIWNNFAPIPFNSDVDGSGLGLFIVSIAPGGQGSVPYKF